VSSAIALALLLVATDQQMMVQQVAAVLVKPPTPIRGWNSFDFGDGTERPYNTPDVPTLMSLVKAVQHNLLPFGYDYFTVDGGWFDAATPGLPTNSSVPTVDRWGRPAPKPDLYPELQGGKGWQPVADAAHAAGLKFGLWWILGVPTEAVARKLPIQGSRYTCDQIVRHTSDGSDWGACMWDHSTYRTNFSHPGTLDYLRSVVKLWEEWGVDLIKLDCTYSGGNLGHAGSPAAIDTFSSLINASTRPFVLSLSPGNGDPNLLKQSANLLTMARITTDFHPNWPAVRASFATAAAAAPVAHASNVLADLDCLAFGDMNGRTENTQDEWHRTRRTIMTLWTIVRSPLIFGGDPRSLYQSGENGSAASREYSCAAPDNITFHCGLHDDVRQLITNWAILNASDDVLAPTQLRTQGNTIVWSASSVSSAHVRYLAIFNAPANDKDPSASPPRVVVTPGDLKLSATHLNVFELLNQTSQLGVGAVQASPAPFDAALFRVVAAGSGPAPPSPPGEGLFRCENATCVPCGASGGTHTECAKVCGPPPAPSDRLKTDEAGTQPPLVQRGPWLSQPFVSGVGGYHSYRIPALVTLPRKTATGEPELLAFCEGRKLNCDDVDVSSGHSLAMSDWPFWPSLLPHLPHLPHLLD
jgi:alpha-galactosidase